MQTYCLHNIAKIESGKSFRQKPESALDGDCYLIQMKDVSSDGIGTEPMRIKSDEINPNQLLERGDLLFVAKGNNNYAVVFDEAYPAVAMSLFFVIRPDRSKIDPHYLSWCINSKDGQRYFEMYRMGATVGNIRVGVLEQFELPVPEMELQKKISKLKTLIRKEQYLTNEYLAKKELLVDEYFKTIIQ